MLGLDLALSQSTECDVAHQCYALGTIVACLWFALTGPCAFTPNPQPWTPLLMMGIMGHCQQEQEYGYLSYPHHVILILGGVNHLSTLSPKSSAHVASQLL